MYQGFLNSLVKYKQAGGHSFLTPPGTLELETKRTRKQSISKLIILKLKLRHPDSQLSVHTFSPTDSTFKKMYSKVRNQWFYVIYHPFKHQEGDKVPVSQHRSTMFMTSLHV